MALASATACVANSRQIGYFKEKRVQEFQKEQQIKLLEAQGATRLDTKVSIK